MATLADEPVMQLGFKKVLGPTLAVLIGVLVIWVLPIDTLFAFWMRQRRDLVLPYRTAFWAITWGTLVLISVQGLRSRSRLVSLGLLAFAGYLCSLLAYVYSSLSTRMTLHEMVLGIDRTRMGWVVFLLAPLMTLGWLITPGIAALGGLLQRRISRSR